MTPPAHGWRSHYALLRLLLVSTLRIPGGGMGTLSEFLLSQKGNEALRRALALICTLRPCATGHLTLASAPRPAALQAGTAS